MRPFLNLPKLDGEPTCADPSLLPVVDEAFAKPGGPAGAELKRLCAGCEVRDQCLAEAMERPEFGIWGGTSPHMRTRAGAVSPKLNLSFRQFAS